MLYYCFIFAGNIDDVKLLRPVLEATSLTLLEDKVVLLNLLGVTVELFGLSQAASYNGIADAMLKQLKSAENAPLALIAGHYPNYVQNLKDSARPFLALVGHTHGGQVQLPFIGPLVTGTNLPNAFVDGYLEHGPGMVSVSRGIGMVRGNEPQVRFLCRPELRVITLMPPE